MKGDESIIYLFIYLFTLYIYLFIYFIDAILFDRPRPQIKNGF